MTLTWEGMHPGTANDDRIYAKGFDKGRQIEAGYLAMLLNDELTQMKKSGHVEDGDVAGLSFAINYIEKRAEKLAERGN